MVWTTVLFRSFSKSNTVMATTADVIKSLSSSFCLSFLRWINSFSILSCSFSYYGFLFTVNLLKFVHHGFLVCTLKALNNLFFNDLTLFLYSIILLWFFYSIIVDASYYAGPTSLLPENHLRCWSYLSIKKINFTWKERKMKSIFQTITIK